MRGYIDSYGQPKVKFGDELKDARIMLTESEDALIGTGMLSGHILKIDFIRKEVEIE